MTNELIEKIVKIGNKWQVQSEKGRNMGTYDTFKEAEKRLQQIHYFKHLNESTDETDELDIDSLINIKNIDKYICPETILIELGQYKIRPDSALPILADKQWKPLLINDNLNNDKCIYVVKNDLTNQLYIGKASDLADRISAHAKTKKRDSKFLHAAIDYALKHNPIRLDIPKISFSWGIYKNFGNTLNQLPREEKREQLNQAEVDAIAKYKTFQGAPTSKYDYNLTPGGEGGRYLIPEYAWNDIIDQLKITTPGIAKTPDAIATYIKNKYPEDRYLEMKNLELASQIKKIAKNYRTPDERHNIANYAIAKSKDNQKKMVDVYYNGKLKTRCDSKADARKYIARCVIQDNLYLHPLDLEVKNRIESDNIEDEIQKLADWLEGSSLHKSGRNFTWNGWHLEGIQEKKPEQTTLTEDTRNQLISKSRNMGGYKDDTSRGKNRFERKKFSKISTQVKSYNQIDMNKFFKQDMLEVNIPINGETASYVVTIRFNGVADEIAKNIKNNGNKFEFRTVLQALTKVFNTANIYVKCTCDDFKYRFSHWSIVNNYSVNDTASDPGPGKGIANPHDDKGKGCKHILLVLSNQDWLMKVCSVVYNYINYAQENMLVPFQKIIFPKLYGINIDDAIEKNLVPEDTKLETEKHIIDVINDWAKNRGKYKPGSNKNPVSGTGGRNKANIGGETEND